MPFMLADPMVGSLLAGSASDLATIAKHSGMSRVADESTEIATAISNALARRVTTNGTIHAVDMRHERLLDNHLTIATPMTAWAPGISDEALLRNAQLVHHGNLAGNHGVLTASTDNAWFDAQRYWQGPTWPHMDELVARGLERSASEPGRPAAVRDAVAEAVGALDARTRAAITRDASPEYRHAISGETVGKTHMSFSSGSLLMHARRTGNSGLDDAASAYEAASNWRPNAPR
jgi:glycogen debranching enzyme